MAEPMPRDQDGHPAYNAEPGVVPVPGSNYIKHVAQFEQFHTKWTAGTAGPGNPYTYRPFPKMLYRAQRYQGKGRWLCEAAPPDPYADWRDPRQFERAQEGARAFNKSCRRVVNSPEEMSRAFEEGWRESPDEAVAFRRKRDDDEGVAAAHREYEDRNMSEPAKREMEAQKAAHGYEHQPEKVETPKAGPRQTIRFCSGTTKAGKSCGVKLTGDKTLCKRHGG